MDDPFYHDGMRELQDRFDGRRVADALEERRLHTEFWEDERALIASLPIFFIATAHGGRVDCSVRSGDPGFIRVTGPATVEWPEYDGNSMYRTLGNMLRSPAVGLLFVRFDGTTRRIRAHGRAELLEGDAAAHLGTRLGVRVHCDAIYPNCPRYLPDLEHGTPSPHVPRPGHTPPAPEWKTRDYIRPILPRDDPFR